MTILDASCCKGQRVVSVVRHLPACHGQRRVLVGLRAMTLPGIRISFDERAGIAISRLEACLKSGFPTS